MKICTKCKDLKSLDKFNKDKSKKDGLCSSCKGCQKILNSKKDYKAIYHKNKENVFIGAIFKY